MNGLELLRKFEPLICFTYGEFFFPCAVDGYLKQCSLWLRDDKDNEHKLLPEGEVTVKKLAQYKEIPAKHSLYLRFIDQPLEALDFQRWWREPDRPIFFAPGRLTRVGLFSRILDSIFTLSLVVRGKVPGGTAAAADLEYRRMQENDPRCIYYGRVIHEGGYIILHYLFFYPMNNWRSGFYGVNDHEADWEQIFIYLSDEGQNEPIPCWVAYASHDFAGDDVRRRWDDPELHKHEQNHPIVFAGAGSHASYFQSGEYLMGIEPEFLRPLKNVGMALRRFWAETLGQGDREEDAEQGKSLLSVPFVDYARGDGVRIGPGQKRVWSPLLLTPDTGWVEQYRGLWGLDTRDPLGGERAPAGPKFNRDGAVRKSWYDPLGWGGLDKITPPGNAHKRLQEKISTLVQERDTLEQELDQKRRNLRLLALEVQALQQNDYLSALFEQQEEKLDLAQEELHVLYARYAELNETLQASQSYVEKIERGDWGDPQAHIQQKHHPHPPLDEHNRLAELWAAVSVGLLLLVFTILLIFFPAWWFTWLILVGGIFITIEATLRSWLANLLLNVTIVFGLITGLILVIDFWWVIILVGLFALVITMMRENIRELRRK